MSTTTILKDARGYPIGKLEDRGNEIIICNMTGVGYGRYNKANDRTTDMNGRPVGSGNLLAILLPRS